MAEESRNGKGPEGHAPHFGIDLCRDVEEILVDVVVRYGPRKKDGNRNDDYDDAGEITKCGSAESSKGAVFDDARGPAGPYGPYEGSELGDAEVKAEVVTEASGEADEHTRDEQGRNLRIVVEEASEEDATDEREKKRGIGGVVICSVVDAGKPEQDTGERHCGECAASKSGGEGKTDSRDSSFREGVVDAGGEGADAEEFEPEREQIKLGRAV